MGHAFVDAVGVPEAFDQLVWAQALADVRGETSQDAWENRAWLWLNGRAEKIDGKPVIDEKARTTSSSLPSPTAVAIYQLSFRLTSTTRNFVNASIRCSRHRLWLSAFVWWRSYFLLIPLTSFPSDTVAALELI